MASNSDTLHEDPAALTPATVDCHRAIVSLMEELEAIDWYQQRIEACSDSQLKSILEHNRDEEKEHAVMVLEWLRRRDPEFARQMEAHLFTKGEIAIEAEDKVNGSDQRFGGPGDGSLNIGSLRGEPGR